MGLTPEEKRRFLRALEEDEEFRLAVAGAVGLGEVLRELRDLRRDSERRWRRWYKTWKKFQEENEKRWQENEKRWQENERRWQEWYETWRKFQEENEKRWQEWYETWRKFLEENERRWAEHEKLEDQRFKWVQSALMDIREALGRGLEHLVARAVEDLLRERGVDCRIRVNVTLPTAGYKEVDIFCPSPLVVGEVTTAVKNIKEAEDALAQLRRSVEAAERFTGAATQLKVLAVGSAPREVAEYLRKKAEEEGIHLILGREY
ncbi:hypothetical protein ODS41_08885 [Pyrobaculum sp. 3827-6]|uniref:hypothetical protein n=1 Tax=Pyrobaculum sp. 3827-6 TaxID=2983604 RepID=UPI0021D877B0|nr:hypothetical protein [Pyrobaculum sp. 3827-6]MCU7788025.1 hypothetical protein [Pyrobaculum sp. 3827-6]